MCSKLLKEHLFWKYFILNLKFADKYAKRTHKEDLATYNEGLATP